MKATAPRYNFITPVERIEWIEDTPEEVDTKNLFKVEDIQLDSLDQIDAGHQ